MPDQGTENREVEIAPVKLYEIKTVPLLETHLPLVVLRGLKRIRV